MLKIGSVGKDRLYDIFISSSTMYIFAIIVTILVGLAFSVLMGGLFGDIGRSIAIGIFGMLALAIILLLRQYELTVMLIIAIHIYIDWYLGLGLVAPGLAVLLLMIWLLSGFAQYTGKESGILWLWIVFLVMALFPAMHGVSIPDEVYYYSNVIFGAFIMFWLGRSLARNVTIVRRLLQFLSFIAALLAMHTIIQAVTGIALFSTSNYDAFLASVNNYQIAQGTGVYRAGSFFINPDTNGGFLSMMTLLPLSLFVESSSLLEKILYIVALLLLVMALLFTYSTESFTALGVGITCFWIFVGRINYRLLLALLGPAVVITAITIFPLQIGLFVQHATGPNEIPLRIAAWETGMQVIRAFPWFGLGLGRHVYLLRADPYRVIAQYKPLDHPHDSFLEIAALGGIPLAVLFL